MRMSASILRIKSDGAKGLYRVNAFSSKEYNFFITINLIQKIVRIFKDESVTKEIGFINFKEKNKIIDTNFISHEIVYMIWHAEKKASEKNDLSENLSYN